MEIELYSTIHKLPDPISAIDRLGSWIAHSGILNIDNENTGKTIALICLTEKISFFDFVRSYDLVLGKPRKKAVRIHAEFLAKGGKVEWLNLGEKGDFAEAEFTLGKTTHKMRFSIEDAKRALLVKHDSNWLKWPANMLRARVMSNAITLLCPDITCGVVEDPTEPASSLPERTLLPDRVIVAEEVPLKTNIVTLPKEEKHPVKEVKPEDSHPELEPVKKEPLPQAEEKFVARLDKDNPTALDRETEKRLVHVIGFANEIPAIAWMEAKKWLKPNQEIKFLRLARAQQILDNPNGFLNIIKGSK